MRILLHCPPPWAPSGYSVQAAILSKALRDLGHDVAISAYAGAHEDGREWQGMRVLNCGGKEYGNGMIGYNAQRHQADVVILLCDAFTIEPNQLKGLTVYPWMPVDCEPLGEMDHMWLQMASQAADIHPVAMSRFGQQMIQDAGYTASYIPHAVDTAIFSPGDGSQWRKEMKIPQDAFLISLVGVNGQKNERKNFTRQMQAFKLFSDRHRKAALYIHSMPQNNQGVNMIKAAMRLGLQGRISFSDENTRNADAHTPEYMASMYRAADFHTQCAAGEGFGVPIIEAMACGTPVVGTRCSAITELIPSDAGRLVNGDKEWIDFHSSFWTRPSITEVDRAYEQMFNVLNSPRGKVMKDAALKNAQKYDVSKIGPRWNEVLAK